MNGHRLKSASNLLCFPGQVLSCLFFHPQQGKRTALGCLQGPIQLLCSLTIYLHDLLPLETPDRPILQLPPAGLPPGTGNRKLMIPCGLSPLASFLFPVVVSSPSQSCYSLTGKTALRNILWGASNWKSGRVEFKSCFLQLLTVCWWFMLTSCVTQGSY